MSATPVSASRKNPRVDTLLARETRWRDEFHKLREIPLDLPLEETVKWGQPCYTHGGKNVVLMHGFNEYCALLFFKGALLDDPHGVLVRQTETVRAARQMRFTNVAQAKRPATRLARIERSIPRILEGKGPNE